MILLRFETSVPVRRVKLPGKPNTTYGESQEMEGVLLLQREPGYMTLPSFFKYPGQKIAKFLGFPYFRGIIRTLVLTNYQK
jgi:hypothetical protein